MGIYLIRGSSAYGGHVDEDGQDAFHAVIQQPRNVQPMRWRAGSCWRFNLAFAVLVLTASLFTRTATRAYSSKTRAPAEGRCGRTQDGVLRIGIPSAGRRRQIPVAAAWSNATPNAQATCSPSNPYTSDGFASMWQKLIQELGDERFNFHALRAYHATRHKAATGALPDLHASPTTTARVYERSKSAKRNAL